MKLRLTLSYLILILLALCSVLPALWIVLSSFKEGNSLYSETFLPRQYTLEHYRYMLNGDKYPYVSWFGNTLKVAASSTLLGTFLTLLGSYAMSRFQFKGRKTGLTLLLVVNMFPSFMSMVAIYILLAQLNLMNSHWALVLVYSSGSFAGNVFVAKGFYDTIPKSLEEAARIDGASHWTVFRRIMLPLLRPMLTYVSLMIFTGAWIDFIFAKLILRSSEKYTLAVGLYDMVSRQNSTEFTSFAAGAVMVAVPILILFIWLQRFLVAGLTQGANKG